MDKEEMVGFVMSLSGSENILDQAMRSLGEKATERGFVVTEDVRGKAEVIRDYISSALAVSLEEKLTHGEIRALLEFYRTEHGKDIAKKMPDIIRGIFDQASQDLKRLWKI